MTHRTLSPYARVALLGIATGSRSQIGMASLALTQPGRARKGVSRIVAGDLARLSYPLAAAGELVVDKLPKTPSRLAPPGLAGRLALGGLGGAILGQRLDRNLALAAAIGAGTAFGSAYAGVKWRVLADRRLNRDAPGAVAEDVLAVKLALLAVTDP